MPPQQPNQTPSLPPPGPEQYDFIMNYGNRSPGPQFLTGSTSMKKRIIIVSVGTAILLIVAIIVIGVISNLSSFNSTPLILMAQEQTEIARVAQEATQAQDAQSTQNFAITTELNMLTQQQAFLNFLKARGINVSTSTLQATKNTNTDSTLKQAQIDGDYDQTYISLAQSEITTYQQNLKQAYNETKILSERQMLSSAYAQATLLTAQSNQTE